MASSLVISGANEGIGYYLAEQCLKGGMNVAILDIATYRLDKLKEIYQGKLLIFQCDVCDFNQVKATCEPIIECFGNIDYLIHNACKAIFRSVEDCQDDDYHSVFDVNFLGAIHCIQAYLPKMKSQNKGKIILMSSGVGVMGFSNLSPYACSKGAIESLAKCMNLEYSHSGITFHLMHPPLSKTTSAKPLPIPEEMKADPMKVGYGFANRLHQKSFIISHSRLQAIQTRLMYLMPISLGKLMDKMTKSHQQI